MSQHERYEYYVKNFNVAALHTSNHLVALSRDHTCASEYYECYVKNFNVAQCAKQSPDCNFRLTRELL